MNVVIYGIGTQAELVYYFFTQDSAHIVVGFCVDTAYLDPHKPTLFGLPIVSAADLPTFFTPTDCQLHIALGHNQRRAQTFASMRALGYSCLNYIGTL